MTASDGGSRQPAVDVDRKSLPDGELRIAAALRTWVRFVLKRDGVVAYPAGMVWVVGLGLTVGGLCGTVLALWPFGVGDPNWELAAFGEVAATLALPGIGLAVLMVAAVRSRNRAKAVGVAVGLVTLGLLAVVGMLLVVLNVPIVWRGNLPPMVLSQLKIAVTKTIALSGLYAVGYLGIGGMMFKRSLLARRNL